ncbi:tyrosine-protein phosphatase non-receptor type substrate 1-like [Pantherophis guttatus]|uniref:Tyrosine-protein phosphatase non-receptor type substrate 1-like n=1 Tax=Pantherophis guttatus TaxID=94885 RepID=A0ABM3YWN7_PANGU|nr:tyrosine-protein phosphatase non-receptor type substrate 1-like [Pantherophis guttatus]
MAALRSFKRIPGLFQLLLLLLLRLLPRELAEPIQLVIHGPPGRVTAGSWAFFNCSAEGLHTYPEVFMWRKDGEALWFRPITIKASTQPPITYRMETMTKLEQGDVKSQLTCHIQETLRTAPLQQSFSLGDFLRVPPKVHLEINPPSPVHPNASVTVTCNVDSFYPDDAKVELFSMDAPNRKGTVAPRTLNTDGTFSLKTSLEVMVTEDGNSSTYLCQVQHNSQPLVNETMTLFIMRQFKDDRSRGGDPECSQQQSLLVLCIALFLSKAAILLFVSCLFLVKVCGRKRTQPPSGTF